VLVVLSVFIIARVFSVAHIPDIMGLRPQSIVPILVLAGGRAVLSSWHGGSQLELFLVSPSSFICSLFKKLKASCIVFTFVDKSVL
jgi:hypothetical protein